MAQMQVAVLEPGDPKQTQLVVQQAVDVLAGGGLVVFPTETVYGVAAAATSAQGVAALRAIKGDTAGRRPFAVHLPDPSNAGEYIDLSSGVLRRLIRRMMPGPVTLHVQVDASVRKHKLAALGLPRECGERIYHDDSVALRCPDHRVTRQILLGAGVPIVAGSANLPGRRAAREAGEAASQLGDRVELIVDGGRTRYAKPSTVVRVTGEGASRAVRVEREGVYDERFVRKLMRWTLLIVCSGNTCRSPMAAGLARQMLAAQRGITEQDLEAAGMSVLSAGVSAAAGMPATEEAVDVLSARGIDITDHRSRLLTPEMIHDADVILTMTEAQRRAVLDLAPSAGEKLLPLDPQGDISDPIGGGPASYERTAEHIQKQLEIRLREQQP